MRRNGDRGLVGGDREILDRGYGFHRTGDRWLPDRWLGMPGFSGGGGTDPNTPVLSDGWDVSHMDGTDYSVTWAQTLLGQSITGAGKNLHSVKFWLNRRSGGDGLGTLTAQLYAATGSFPSVVGTGSPLATSTLPSFPPVTPIPMSLFSRAGSRWSMEQTMSSEWGES